MKLGLIIGGLLIFLAPQAFAKPMKFFEQVALAKYVETAFDGLPSNEAGFSKLLPRLSPADRKAGEKIMRGWQFKKFDYRVSTKLNQLVVSSDEQVLLTLETLETSPAVIRINGTREIHVNGKDVYGSIMAGLQSTQKSATLDNFLQPLFGSKSFADGDYDISKLSGLNQAILLYGDTVVASENLDAPPWSKIYYQYNSATLGVEYIKSLFSSNAFQETKFVCGKDSVSGVMYSKDGTAHKFLQNKDGLLLDGRNLINVKLEQVGIDDERIRNERRMNREICAAVMSQGVRPKLHNCHVPVRASTLCNLTEFRCVQNAPLYGNSLSPSERQNAMNATLASLKDKGVTCATLEVQSCAEGKCTPATVESLLAADSGDPSGLRGVKINRAEVQQSLTEVEDAFQKENGLNEGLGMTKEGGNFKLNKVPPVPLDSSKLAAYKKQLEPLYIKRDSLDQKIAAIANERAETKSAANGVVLSDVYGQVAMGRALMAGCNDNDFKAEASKHKLSMTVDSSPDKGATH